MVARYLEAANIPGIRPLFLENMQGVASNGRAFLNLPVGSVSYHALFLRPLDSGDAEETEGTIDSEVGATSEVKVIADGDDLIRGDYSDIKAVQEFYLPSLYGSSWIPLFFSMPWLENQTSQNATRLGTADVDSLRVELALGTLTNIAKIEVIALARWGETRPLGRVLKTLSEDRDYGSANTETIRDLDVTDKQRSMADLLCALHFNSTNADRLTIKVGGEGSIIDAPKRFWTQSFAVSGRTANGSYSHYDFTSPRNDTVDAIPVNKKPFEVRVDWSAGAPNGYQMIKQFIGGDQPAAAA